MIYSKYICVLCIVAFAGSATGTELDKNVPPNGIEFVKILLKNGSRIEKGCSTEIYGSTLQDKLVSLVVPDFTEQQVTVTYRCTEDQREVKKTGKLTPVWLCRIAGQNVNKDSADKDIAVFTSSIHAYIDKKNMEIIDLLCL